ncbi:hypothetical protein ACGFT2_06505 [Streptomyces sp. NPDC048514]|uniref:hypothetical protein n=1 Tax=Streptomyces sp. NPDC048514 TaxID=3365564 RepID=UPI0037161C57
MVLLQLVEHRCRTAVTGEVYPQVPDREAVFCRVAEGAVEVEAVTGLSSVALGAEEADLFEAGDDALGGALGVWQAAEI